MQVDFDKLATLFADELEKDFDPAAYDAKMAALFGDEYYGEAEMEAPAPQATTTTRRSTASAAATGASSDDDDDDGVPSWVFGEGERPAWAGPSVESLAAGDDGFEAVFGRRSSAALGGAGQAASARGTGEVEMGDESEEEEEDYDPAVSGSRRKKHKRKQKAKSNSILAASRAAIAGGVRIDDTDEVLALGFEDVIGGDLRTRFKYQGVPSNDFGLSAEEILLADDRDLNNYVSLKKMAPYREEEWQVSTKTRKRVVHDIRKKLKEELKPLGLVETREAATEDVGVPAAGSEAGGGGVVEGEEVSESAEEKATRKKHRKHKKAQKHAAAAGEEVEVEEEVEKAPVSVAKAPSGSKSKDSSKPKDSGIVKESAAPTSGSKRKRSHSKPAKVADPEEVVEMPTGGKVKKSRLASYGIE